jgi:hypothetical protein
MELNKTQKIVLGIFTVIPFFLLPVILWQVFHGVLEIIELSEINDPEPKEIFGLVFSFLGPILLLTFGSLALLIFYIVHTVTNKSLEAAEKLLWVLLFIFFGIIAFPIYWLVRIWNNSNTP